MPAVGVCAVLVVVLLDEGVDVVAAAELALAELLEDELLPQAPRAPATSKAASAVVILSRIARNRSLIAVGVALISWASMADDGPIGGLPMTTALELPGREVSENLGVIYGLVVRSMGFVGGVGAAFKGLRRGEIGQYTQLLEDSRRHAIDRMVDNARLLGADGVIAVRFDSSEIGQQYTEIVAYGTAVKLRPVA